MKARDTNAYAYDAIVVGARVAGPAVARLLAQAGLRVLMVDRRRPGGDTLSTHALMRAGVLQLSRWGLLDRLRDAGTPTVSHAVVHYGDEVERVDIRSRHGIDGLYAPRRTVLDSLLVDAAVEAGVDVRFGVTVTDFLHDTTGRVAGIVGRDSAANGLIARAPITIGADGVRSLLARRAGAIVKHHGGSATAVIYSYWSGERIDGYNWVYRPGQSAGLIPTNDDQVNVWVGVSSERFMAEHRFDMEGSFHRLFAAAAPALTGWLDSAERRSRFYGHPGTKSFMRQAHGPGWALVGDASHFKDPISAHGITDALRDAEFLARAIVKGGADSARLERALAEYERLRDELSTELHHVSDAVASYRWSLTELRGLLLRLSRAMKPEVEALQGLDRAPWDRAA